MKYLISGGSGLVGRAIQEQLRDNGDSFQILSRSAGKEHTVKWDPSKGEIDAEAIQTADAIINLAGASVSQRWTAQSKKQILESRIQSTRTLVENLKAAPPKTFVSASAVGIYPSSQDLHSESSPIGDDFLAEVVEAWEKEALKAEAYGHRVVLLRIGIVLSKDGGALEKLVPVFKMGIGSAVGSGKQWMSWIHIDDLARMFISCAQNDQYNGIYNAVAPNPTTNQSLSASLAKAMKKPFWAPKVPAFVLKMVLGEMSQIVLASQQVSSKKIEDNGFQFKYQALDDALDSLF